MNWRKRRKKNLKVNKPFANIYTTEITLKGDSVKLFAFTWRRVHVERC